MDPKISNLVSDLTGMMQDMAVDAGMDAELPDEIDIQAIVSGEIEDAVDYIDSTISPLRAVATEYYRGMPFGNEEDGRSSLVRHARPARRQEGDAGARRSVPWWSVRPAVLRDREASAGMEPQRRTI